MSDTCFLSVLPVRPGSRAVKEIAVLSVDDKTLEPLTDVYFKVDDPEADHSEGGPQEGELGGSLDEALAGAASYIDGAVLAGFAADDDWSLLQGAYERQGILVPKPQWDTLDVKQLAWPMLLGGAVAGLEEFWAVAKALGIPVRTNAQGIVYAAAAVAKKLIERAQLGARLGALNSDEHSIALKILDRLEEGRREYGPWDVRDGRDYVNEALEEAIDGFVYCAAGLVGLEAGHRDTVPAPETGAEVEVESKKGDK